MPDDLTVVVGGGAAGICAAISAVSRGAQAIICEKNSQIGKKILATGNGRCNLLTDDFSELHYNENARQLVRSVLDTCGKSVILGLFDRLGLKTYSQAGRIFPVTNQAASVLKVLDIELKRLSVPTELEFECVRILKSGHTFTIFSHSGKRIQCQKVVLTGGGKSYPALGSDGSAHELAASLGHTIIEPVPSAVPLVVRSNLCHLLQGQRIQASAKSVIAGSESPSVPGELLFTKYGLSGTCILDLSGPISIALNRHKRTDVWLSVDLVPFMSRQLLMEEIERRKHAGTPPEDILVGILPNKFGLPLKSLFESVGSDEAASRLKAMRFDVVGTRGWNEAEFTAGGVSAKEVRFGSLESTVCRGVYLAGEILDVDGDRGGFNLGWAWASGWVAGLGR